MTVSFIQLSDKLEELRMMDYKTLFSKNLNWNAVAMVAKYITVVNFYQNNKFYIL